MIGIEDDFSDRFGLLLCFLRGHFVMFSHGWFLSGIDLCFFENT
jgi:hypothetical protein